MIFFYFVRSVGDNTFYSNIDSMPDIRPRRKSIPLVSELVSIHCLPNELCTHTPKMVKIWGRIRCLVHVL